VEQYLGSSQCLVYGDKRILASHSSSEELPKSDHHLLKSTLKERSKKKIKVPYLVRHVEISDQESNSFLGGMKMCEGFRLVTVRLFPCFIISNNLVVWRFLGHFKVVVV
jgi:hypothetical protein